MGEAPTLAEVPGCRPGGPVNKRDSWEGRPLWLGCKHMKSSASWTCVGLAVTWDPLTEFLLREIRLGPGDVHLQQAPRRCCYWCAERSVLTPVDAGRGRRRGGRAMSPVPGQPGLGTQRA